MGKKTRLYNHSYKKYFSGDRFLQWQNIVKWSGDNYMYIGNKRYKYVTVQDIIDMMDKKLKKKDVGYNKSISYKWEFTRNRAIELAEREIDESI